MRERRLAMRSPRHDASRKSDRGPFLGVTDQRLGLTREMLSVERVRVWSNAGGFQGLEFLPSRLEDEVEVLAHAAAVVEPPPCLRYASMNGSIPPSITFWTSGILSSVRWSLTIVYGWKT